MLLESFLKCDRDAVQAHCDLIEVAPGDHLIRAGQDIEHLWFPICAVLSLELPGRSDGHTEIGLVGYEGVAGWPALIGCSRASHGVVAQLCPGKAFRLPAVVARTICGDRPSLLVSIFQYLETITIQMSRTILSSSHDTVQQRLCRWILMRHDRIDGDDLHVQHQEISFNLNVRRASVTDALHHLEGRRLIRCNRGRIQVRDRSGLEACAGEAYGFAEARYNDLIGPFGRRSSPEGMELPSAFRPRTAALAA